jgi:hypothetical protein
LVMRAMRAPGRAALPGLSEPKERGAAWTERAKGAPRRLD